MSDIYMCVCMYACSPQSGNMGRSDHTLAQAIEIREGELSIGLLCFGGQALYFPQDRAILTHFDYVRSVF